MIISQQPSGSDPAKDEVITTAHGIVAVADPHDYLNNLIDKLGDRRPVGLQRIIEVAAQSALWNDYIKTVKAWFEEKRPALVEGVA